MKTIIFLTLTILLFPHSGFSYETITLPCEVLDASKSLHSAPSNLKDIRYILLRHANAADMETLSKWLKARSGTEIKFSANQKDFSGVMYRMPQCFGRGLIIFSGDIEVKKRDIIEVVLPLNP